MKNIDNRSRVSGIAIAAALLFGGTPAFSQAAPAEKPEIDQAPGHGLDEIVVTAQRRTENLQDVPIAITAADAEALATARVENISNIDAISPSIQVRTTNISTSSANVIIRGLGTSGNSRTFEGAVGIFIDGVYRTRAAAALNNFIDIDGLQILRGPQGTLFGKNTSAGALLLASGKPNINEFEGNYQLGYGNFEALDVRGAVNLPVGELAAVRFAAMHTAKDGYFTDVNTGKDLNGNTTNAFKGQALIEPTDRITVRYIGDYSKSKGNCCYATANFIDGPTQPLVDLLTQLKGLQVPSSDPKDWEQALNHDGNQEIEDYGHTLLADFEVGNGTLKSVTALRRFKVGQFNVDPDFSGADIFSLDETFNSKFFSQELTYNGKLEALNADFVLGGFFASEKLDMIRNLRWESQGQMFWDFALSGAPFNLPFGTVNAAPGLWASEAMKGDSKSYAAFAHFDFKLSDQFNVIGGLRYSIEKKTGSFRNTFYPSAPNDVFLVLGPMPGPAYSAKTTNKALSGTFGLQYHPSDDFMIYATYNRGFKAGGVNMDANGVGARANNPAVMGPFATIPAGCPITNIADIGQCAIYKPETIDAFELGAKIEYLDGRARTNIAVFYNSIKDFQVAKFLGLRFAVENAPTSETYGLEIENLFQVTDGLTLGLDGLWLPHANYGSDGVGYFGERFRFAPKIAGNATLNLDQPLNDSLNLAARVQYQYSGTQFIDPASPTGRPALNLVNANLGLRNPDGKWQIDAWVQNLFDKAYYQVAFPTPLQTGDENAYMGAPRTYGVTLRGKF